VYFGHGYSCQRCFYTNGNLACRLRAQAERADALSKLLAARESEIDAHKATIATQGARIGDLVQTVEALQEAPNE
jgi:hypothetical protein